MSREEDTNTINSLCLEFCQTVKNTNLYAPNLGCIFKDLSALHQNAACKGDLLIVQLAEDRMFKMVQCRGVAENYRQKQQDLRVYGGESAGFLKKMEKLKVQRFGALIDGNTALEKYSNDQLATVRIAYQAHLAAKSALDLAKENAKFQLFSCLQEYFNYAHFF